MVLKVGCNVAAHQMILLGHVQEKGISLYREVYRNTRTKVLGETSGLRTGFSTRLVRELRQ
jgi:hypothetical protein